MSTRALPVGQAALVGREAERRRLQQALDAAGAQTGLVLVSGEPGIGKSRLLAEVASRAEGRQILRGGAHESQGQPAYVLFVEALRSYLDQADFDREQALARLGPLARLLPELDSDAGAGALGPIDRQGLLEQAALFFRSLAGDGPLLLLLEDLHWADPASIDLLAYLRRRLRDAPLLILASYRDADLDNQHPLAEMLVEMNRLRLAEELRLRPLDEGQTGELLSALLGGPASPGLAAEIHRQSEGNPFFIEELARALVADGRLSPDADGWSLVSTAGGAGDAALPPGLRAWLWARLRRLSPACLSLLEVAAVLGRRVDPALVLAAHGGAEDEVTALLREAARHQILAPRDDGYEFAHDQFRAALEHEIEPLRRRRLHAQAAAAYEALDLAGVRPAAVAYHLLRGADPARALPYLVRAGRRALAGFAYRTAAEHFSAAANLLRQSDQDERLADVLPALGEALAGDGRYDAALASYAEALTLAPVASDRIRAGHLHTRMGQVYIAREEAQLAVAAHQRALEAFGGLDHQDVARTLLQVSELNLMGLSRHAEGAEQARQAMAMAMRLGRADLAAEARGLLGTALVRTGHDEGVEVMRQALADALQVGETALAGTIAVRLAHQHYWAAELDESVRAAEQALDLVRGVTDPHRLGWPTFWLGVAAFSRGEWDEAERRAAALIELGEQLGVRRFVAQAHQIRGMVAQDRGALAVAVDHLRQAAAQLRTIAPGTLVFYLGRYCLALLDAGATAEGAACLAELEELALALPPEAKPRNSGLNLVALAYLKLGRPDEGQRLERDLRPAAGQLHWTLVARTLGELALARRDLGAAADYLGLAGRIAARAGARPELARTWRALARLERERSQPASAVWARALELERQASDLEHQLGMSAPTDGPISRPLPPEAVPLSTRELEVLRLVAEGLSNRQIAETLVISERTVVHHITHILDKLNVPSRAAATTFGFRHGLLQASGVAAPAARAQK